MSDFDVHPDEMRRWTIDDEAAEAVLSGRVPPDHPDLAEMADFVADVRLAYRSGSVPPVGPALAGVLTAGLTTEKGELPVTAGSKADGPAEQASGLPKWRRQPMLTRLLGSRTGRIAAGLTAALAATGALGVAGALPNPFHSGDADAPSIVRSDPANSDENQGVDPEKDADQPGNVDNQDQADQPEPTEPPEQADEPEPTEPPEQVEPPDEVEPAEPPEPAEAPEAPEAPDQPEAPGGD